MKCRVFIDVVSDYSVSRALLLLRKDRPCQNPRIAVCKIVPWPGFQLAVLARRQSRGHARTVLLAKLL